MLTAHSGLAQPTPHFHPLSSRRAHPGPYQPPSCGCGSLQHWPLGAPLHPHPQQLRPQLLALRPWLGNLSLAAAAILTNVKDLRLKIYMMNWGMGIIKV